MKRSRPILLSLCCFAVTAIAFTPALAARQRGRVLSSRQGQLRTTTPVRRQQLPPAKVVAGGNSSLTGRSKVQSSSQIVALPSTLKLGKFEPAQGCYIGAFIEKDFAFQYKTSGAKIEEYEKLTGKKHASYFTYCGYGTPFPSDWVAAVKRAGAAPHIAFEPNEGLNEVNDGAYLRAWARDAARSGVPIFLRWASEMNGPWMRYNGAPALYRTKFQLVAKIMHEEAPNVAMVWTPFTEPKRVIASYYPGDAAVDWVGINIYSVYVNDGDPNRPAYNKDPLDQLRFIYNNYAPRKPIHISEYAATLACKGTELDTSDFAIQKMTRFYEGIKNQFPRVKSVNWFLLDTIRAGLANNNYSFLQNGKVLNVYAKLVGDPYFLSEVATRHGDFATTVKDGTTIGAKGIRLREGTPSDFELLANHNWGRDGSTAGTSSNTGISTTALAITEPRIRGLRNGEIIDADLELRVDIPPGINALGVIWKIDGKTIAITNTTPYRMLVSRDKYEAGPHTVEVQVVDKTSGATQSSPPVDFEWK